MDLNNLLVTRATLLSTVRSFFVSRGYLEVETPVLVASPDLSPNLTPFETTLTSVNGETRKAHLITSPEFSMKKLLGMGMERGFTITKVFRNDEPWTDATTQHNPEFTMIEWYAQGENYRYGMEETEALVRRCAEAVGATLSTDPFARVHIPTRFREVTGLELADASKDDLRKTCERLELQTDEKDTWSDLFHRVFVTHIEPHLPKTGAFVYDFPKQQAALATLTPDKRYAERFELYLEGSELCNAFTELTDTTEQRQRFLAEQEERRSLGKTVFPVDENLLALLPSVRTPTFGNALGIDRLLMVLLNKASIEDVLVFPAKKLFT